MIGMIVRGSLRHVDAVLVVDDGSQDGTAALAREAGAHVVRHPRRQGKGRALRTGFAWARAAGFDCVITLDGDGQHDPADIPRLTAADGRAAIVVGCRAVTGRGVPVLRVFGNRLSTAVVSRLAGRAFRDSQSGFRRLRRVVLDRLDLQADGFEMESELLVRAARLGLAIAEVPVWTRYGLPGSDFRPFWDSVRFAVRCCRLLGDLRRDVRRWERNDRTDPRTHGPGAVGVARDPRSEGDRGDAADAAASLSADDGGVAGLR